MSYKSLGEVRISSIWWKGKRKSPMREEVLRIRQHLTGP